MTSHAKSGGGEKAPEGAIQQRIDSASDVAGGAGQSKGEGEKGIAASLGQVQPAEHFSNSVILCRLRFPKLDKRLHKLESY